MGRPGVRTLIIFQSERACCTLDPIGSNYLVHSPILVLGGLSIIARGLSVAPTTPIVHPTALRFLPITTVPAPHRLDSKVAASMCLLNLLVVREREISLERLEKCRPQASIALNAH